MLPVKCFLRPCRGGGFFLTSYHGFRPPPADSTRGYNPRPLSGPFSRFNFFPISNAGGKQNSGLGDEEKICLPPALAGGLYGSDPCEPALAGLLDPTFAALIPLQE